MIGLELPIEVCWVLSPSPKYSIERASSNVCLLWVSIWESTDRACCLASIKRLFFWSLCQTAAFSLALTNAFCQFLSSLRLCLSDNLISLSQPLNVDQEIFSVFSISLIDLPLRLNSIDRLLNLNHLDTIPQYILRGSV